MFRKGGKHPPTPPQSELPSPVEAYAPRFRRPSTYSECDSAIVDLQTEDSDCDMAAEDVIPPHSRPLSVAIPPPGIPVHGPYCPRRPTLAEILSNTSSPPWTLTAFMGFLSQNHCLETLEFTMDAGRYRKHYNKVLGQGNGQIQPSSSGSKHLCMLWQRLLEAYIFPNGEREVNIPADIRDSLLTSSNPHQPPQPMVLDPAVQKVYELMEDSVLVPFLNQYAPDPPDLNMSDHGAYNSSQENLSQHPSAHHRAAFRHGSRRRTSPSPVSGGILSPESMSSNTSHRHISTPTPTSAALTSGSLHYNTGDDTSSMADSPTASSDLMTPPTTPPMSDSGGRASPPSSAHGLSPRSSRDGNAWKKMSGSLRTLMSKNHRIREDEESMDLD